MTNEDLLASFMAEELSIIIDKETSMEDMTELQNILGLRYRTGEDLWVFSIDDQYYLHNNLRLEKPDTLSITVVEFGKYQHPIKEFLELFRPGIKIEETEIESLFGS